MLSLDIEDEIDLLQEIADLYEEYTVEFIILIPSHYSQVMIDSFEDDLQLSNYRIYIVNNSGYNGLIQGIVRAKGLMILNSLYYQEDIPDLPKNNSEKFIVLKENTSALGDIKVITKAAAMRLLSKSRYQNILFYHEAQILSEQNDIHCDIEYNHSDDSFISIASGFIMHSFVKIISKYFQIEEKKSFDT